MTAWVAKSCVTDFSQSHKDIQSLDLVYSKFWLTKLEI